MVVNSTEMQNNFGKYLMLSLTEDIIITKNGMQVAKLTAVGSGCKINEQPAEYFTYGGYGGRKATYEEYLELTKDSEATGERYEYIDGEIYYLASPKTAHQIALAEIFGMFYNWFQGKGCRPMVAPYDITLKRHKDDINVVQPDIMVICDLEEKLNDKGYYMGAPALAVEILSQGTRAKDLVKKLDLYMHCGIREYWVVSPIKKDITIFLLRDGDIEDNVNFASGEAKSFIFPGLAVELERIFSNKL